MKKCGLLFLIITVCFAYLSPIAVERDGESENKTPLLLSGRGVLIAQMGDIRGIMGSQGKNITVCQHGDNVAVIYGAPSANPNNPMAIKIAYSVDSGAMWTTYGPFSPELRRTYPGVDGSANFCTNPGELYFVWQENQYGYNGSDLVVMIEEGIPSASSLAYLSLGVDGWFPCVAVALDDPDYVIITFSNVDAVYAMITNDGGYTWSDTVNMYIANSPHVRFGSGAYLFATYHDILDTLGTSLEWPYYTESTNNGWTWSQGQPLPVPYAAPTSMFWWHEFDCEVVNNEPWAVHTDLGTDSMWLFHGTGNPGNWTWEVFNARQIGAESLWVGDTLYYCYPSQYPNVSYEPVSNTILISYKAYYLKICSNDTIYNGAHIGGIYSTDNGVTWTITAPLSDPNTGQIAWYDWSATEVAHRLVNINGDVYSYGIWVNGTDLNLYFERGMIKPFYATGIEENSNSLASIHFQISPTITTDICYALFAISSPGTVNLKLFDAAGRLVEEVYDGYLEKGNMRVGINTKRLANGIYFVSLETKKGTQTAKFIIAR
jgi:hypothetical protein